jgi:hypothetical protein
MAHALQHLKAWREREAVAVNGVAQQLRERDRFFVCWVKVHDPVVQVLNGLLRVSFGDDG